jgi:hypothetical protein
MNITSAKYMNATNLHDGTTYKDTIKTTIDGVDMFVPLDPDNRHYQAIQEWVAEGNKIEDAD